MELAAIVLLISTYLCIGIVLTYRRGGGAIAMVAHEHPLMGLLMLLSSWLFWPFGKYASAPILPLMILSERWGRFYHYSWLDRRLMGLKSRYLAWRYRRKYGELPIEVGNLDVSSYYPCAPTNFGTSVGHHDTTQLNAMLEKATRKSSTKE